jgi:hypothetical protein
MGDHTTSDPPNNVTSHLFLLLETLFDGITVEFVAIRAEQTGLQERRRIVNLMFLGLNESDKVRVNTWVMT